MLLFLYGDVGCDLRFFSSPVIFIRICCCLRLCALMLKGRTCGVQISVPYFFLHFAYRWPARIVWPACIETHQVPPWHMYTLYPWPCFRVCLLCLESAIYFRYVYNSQPCFTRISNSLLSITLGYCMGGAFAVTGVTWPTLFIYSPIYLAKLPLCGTS